MHRTWKVSCTFHSILSQSMIVTSALNASRGAATARSPQTFGHIQRSLCRTTITPPRTFYSTRVPLHTRTPLSNSPLHFPRQEQHQSRLKQPRNLRGTQLRHCSHRRTMCRHQHEADGPGSSFDITQGREILPANVKPIHYHLTLEPNLETFEYKGTVVIE